jgi:CheY-like chemotaxis protein
MNGSIRVESEPGKGSAFIFNAVLGRAEDMETIEETAALSDLEKLKVLVVDDVASAREMLQVTLESFSFRVTCVASGMAALETIEAAPPEDPYKLVLMDWRMPQMDGIETSRRIKNMPELADMPTIIMVTAYGREDVMQQAEEVGLEGFLIKPVTPSTLLDTIMGVVGKKGGFRRAGDPDPGWYPGRPRAAGRRQQDQPAGGRRTAGPGRVEGNHRQQRPGGCRNAGGEKRV